MAHPDPAWSVVLGSEDLLAHILQSLPNRDRARCESVCRLWRAASLAAPQGWARVEWAGRYDEELYWLASRGPVCQAKLTHKYDNPAAVPFFLGACAPSLRELGLSTSEEEINDFGFLGWLQQLTLLSLRGTAHDPENVSGVRRLGRLRALSWCDVPFNDDPHDGAELPLPPRLQHLRVGGDSSPLQTATVWWRFPPQLSALGCLQTLVLERLPAGALPPSLAEITALTVLELSCCVIEGPPPGLGQCTGLCRLTLGGCPGLGASPEGVAELGRALRRMPRLEALGLPGCGLAALPPLAGGRAPPLRRLHISGNACAIADADWLASLELLQCSWWQVPGQELCGGATQLTEVVLEPARRAGGTWPEVVTAVRGLVALPALQAMHFLQEGPDWARDRDIIDLVIGHRSYANLQQQPRTGRACRNVFRDESEALKRRLFCLSLPP